MYYYGPPHMTVQKQDDQHDHTFSSCVRIRDVVLRTCLGRWTIGRSGERGSGISVLPARHDDDDDCFITLIVDLNKICVGVQKKFFVQVFLKRFFARCPIEYNSFKGRSTWLIYGALTSISFPVQRETENYANERVLNNPGTPILELYYQMQ